MAKNSGPVRTVHERTYGAERDKMVEVTKAEIEKKFGTGSIMRYGDGGPQLEVEAIPTGSLALDAALGIGGVPRGRIVEIYGPESSGKTTLSLEILAEAQAAGGVVAFIDAEHALDPTYAARIGVDIDEVLISQPDTGEQALEICDMLVRSGAIDVIVIDSVAALVPRAEIEGEIGDSSVGLQARLMSQALRKLAGSLAKSNTTCIFINQLREKIGVMFGNPETTTGGRALKFFSSVRIDIRRIDSIKDGNEIIGNRVRTKIVKNKVAAPLSLPSSTSCTVRVSPKRARFSIWLSSTALCGNPVPGTPMKQIDWARVVRRQRISCARILPCRRRLSIKFVLPVVLNLTMSLRARLLTLRNWMTVLPSIWMQRLLLPIWISLGFA